MGGWERERKRDRYIEGGDRKQPTDYHYMIGK